MRLRDPRLIPIPPFPTATDALGAATEAALKANPDEAVRSEQNPPPHPATAQTPNPEPIGEGDDAELILDIGPVAHGGHCVARIGSGPDAGRVVFVRHALPGERVRARLTERGKVWRADAMEIIASPSEYRVPSSWPEAGAGGVGGGELAHVSPAGQRRWKAAVLAEQLHRLAGIDLTYDATLRDGPAVAVEALGDGETTGYRTRVELVTDAKGRAGMSKHRSREIVPLTDMPLATPALREFLARQRAWHGGWPANARLLAVVPANGTAEDGVLLVNGEVWHDGAPAPEASGDVVEQVRGYRYQVAADGFWQVHQLAPKWLVDTVLASAALRPGNTVLDLYSGAGLFTLPIADAVGVQGQVIAIEGNKKAAAYAKTNAKPFPQIKVLSGDVAQTLRRFTGDGRGRGAIRLNKVDVVILDPPRVGAGRQVVDQIAALKPVRVVYVACDPAALARDISYFTNHGYQLTGLKAADLFPSTHHVEAVATLTKELDLGRVD